MKNHLIHLPEWFLYITIGLLCFAHPAIFDRSTLFVPLIILLAVIWAVPVLQNRQIFKTLPNSIKLSAVFYITWNLFSLLFLSHWDGHAVFFWSHPSFF